MRHLISLLIFTVGIAVGSGLAAQARCSARIVLLRADRRRAAWACSASTSAGRLPRSPAPSADADDRRPVLASPLGPAHRLRAVRPRRRRRPVHRAVLRGHPGLSARRPPRPHHRRLSTCRTPPSWRAAASSWWRCRAWAYSSRLFAARHRKPVVLALGLRSCRRVGAPRCAASIIFRAFYRLEVKGLENLDKAGPNAVVTPNHVSLIDAPILLASCRPRRSFAVDTGIAQTWWAKPFLKLDERRCRSIRPSRSAPAPSSMRSRPAIRWSSSRKAASPSPTA